MATSTTPITRALNKQFKGILPEGLRIQAGAAGSFLSIRIEDPQGLLTVALAQKVVEEAHRMFWDANMISERDMGMGYWEGGVVINWKWQPRR